MQKRVIQVFFSLVCFLMLATITPLSVFAAPAFQNYIGSSSATNPYSPAYNHSYRHGVIPTLSQSGKIKSYQQSIPAIPASENVLKYGGGIDGIGVTSGHEKVYLIFWGTQWGSQGTDSNSNLTFSKDASHGAPQLQNLFKGLGTGELWSGTMTQYCDGPTVVVGAIGCILSAAHVGYPTGGALAGVWYDNSGAEPPTATGNQMATEAIKAAGHFGNTTPASNRYAQYVVLSATGTDPDNYRENGFCAWHDYNGDSSLSGGAAISPYGDVSFTNMPYVMDIGTNCGQSFVNAGSNGTIDGYTIVEGHEYAETITDQNPAGGWTNSITRAENGDECAWISAGQPGAAANVITTKGTFAMQSTWSNDTSTCDISHEIVGGGPGTENFSISSSPGSFFLAPGSKGTSKISTVLTSGTAAKVSLVATVAPTGPTVSLSAASVTAGGSATLTISVGSAVALGIYTVTVKGTEGSMTHSASIPLVVTKVTTGVLNGGFEITGFAGWTSTGTTSVSTSAHSGKFAAMVGSATPTIGDSSLSQTFKALTGATTLSFWYEVNCPDVVTYDWATATLTDNTSKTTQTILARTCNTSPVTPAWAKVATSIVAGHSYTLNLISHDDNNARDATYTLYDDVVVK